MPAAAAVAVAPLASARAGDVNRYSGSVNISAAKSAGVFIAVASAGLSPDAFQIASVAPDSRIRSSTLVRSRNGFPDSSAAACQMFFSAPPAPASCGASRFFGAMASETAPRNPADPLPMS